MTTTTVPRRRSYLEALTGGSRSRNEPPYKVGELVYATVLVDTPMSAFKHSCREKISKGDRRLAEQQAETRRRNEENGQIGDKRPRPCVILSTKEITRDKWEYELCLLTSFGNTAYSQLDRDTKRLTLPVYQEGDEPNECESETKVTAFVFKPPLKPRSCSYLIGYPIMRLGSCIQSVIGDVKPAMAVEEVRRLKKYCSWIQSQKRKSSKPKPLCFKKDERSRDLSVMTDLMTKDQSQGRSSTQDRTNHDPVQRVDSPVSYLPSGSMGAGPIAGPSGVSGSVENPTPKRNSGSGASQILEHILSSAGNVIKRAASVVSRLSSRSSGSK